MAYEVEIYKVSWNKPEKGQRGEDAGNYMTVWEKTTDEWKTAAYDLPRGDETVLIAEDEEGCAAGQSRAS